MRTLRADVIAFFARQDPVKVLVLGYASYVLIGWLLLCTPFVNRTAVGALDALFIATSAMSTTGLGTVPTSAFNPLGQVVILILIQLGGIGYMTFGSFVVLSRRHRVSGLRRDVARRAFSLPEGWGLLRFLRNVIVFTTVVEALGALVLWYLFARVNVPEPLWAGLFHSVSAFCTAGFSLFDSSLEAFRGDFWINAVIGVLSYAGALGFIVFTDVWDVMRNRKTRITLTTRIILWATLWLSVLGTIVLFLGDASLRQLPAHERLLAAMFQSMSSITTVGFNTVPIGAMSLASVTIIVALMVIGASPSGTGGGAKVTTISAVFAVGRSALRGSDRVTYWGHEVPLPRVLAAAAALGFYVLVLWIAAYALTLIETHAFEDLLFEASSALGTVGLSRGITSQLSPLGKLTIIAVMFLGRVGPITIATALFTRAHFADDATHNKDDLVI